ncbi:MAG: PadR family transcriptional regulator [Gemmatimonadota bacterium]|nr:PadR family transcriptional regulator [Gemmatimonadota bacterium]
MGRYLGEFEQTVLVALVRCGGEATGGRIHAEILDRTGRDSSISAVYVTLKRMSDKGYVAIREPGALSTTMGRGKNRYTLTGAGAAELGRTREMFERLWRGVDPDTLAAT